MRQNECCYKILIYCSQYQYKIMISEVLTELRNLLKNTPKLLIKPKSQNMDFLLISRPVTTFDMNFCIDIM